MKGKVSTSTDFSSETIDLGVTQNISNEETKHLLMEMFSMKICLRNEKEIKAFLDEKKN